MTELKKSRPFQEVSRLKSWDGGRHSQLRLFMGHLETAFNTSLAAQVSQSSKRKFSEFVPKIVTQDIIVDLEFREIRVAWAPPRGLKNFLFYETQISLTENFSNFDGFVTYDPFFVFPNLLDGRTYYIRIRVVTKDGLFGPWSDTQSITTPFGQAFGLFDGTEVLAPIYNDEDFQVVYTRPYESLGGNVYYSVNYKLQIQSIQVNSPVQNVDMTDIEFQWHVDDEQIGQNFLVSCFSTNDFNANFDTADIIVEDIGEPITDSLRVVGQFILSRTGTFVQKFHSLDAGEHTIQLKARAINPHPTPKDWMFTPQATESRFRGVAYGLPATIRIKNFNIFETLIR